MNEVPSFRRILAVVALSVVIPGSAFAQRACDESTPVAATNGWSAPLDKQVTLRVHDVSLRDALDRLSALAGVELAYSADFIPVARRVCLASEHQALGDLLNVLLKGVNVRVLVVGNKVVLSPMAPPVSVTAADDAGSHSVNVLERVVVTGNAVAAPRRPLAIGVEVIDGDQLRRESLGSMSELLDESVPGLWSWTGSSSSLVAQYGGIRGASSFGSSSPKIYIDGVEVANPLVVTQLNPDVIDRIEVIRGPQGAALYGSDAISGVINVITRHDGTETSEPTVQFRSTEGAAASAYSSRLVTVHEQRLNLRTGTNLKSGGLAMVFGQTGQTFSGSNTTQVAATGDTRLVTSNATYTATGRFFNKTAGNGVNPLLPTMTPTAQNSGGTGNGGGAGDNTTAATTSLSTDPQSVRQYTLSTGATFATDGRWTHSLLAGIDGYSLKNVTDATDPFPALVDSALRAAQGSGDRVTLRESSVAHFGAEGDSQTTLTLGIEQSMLRQTGTYSVQPPPGARGLAPADTILSTSNFDTGIMSQISTSWNDAVFLTGGLRLERNDAFTGSNRYPLLPMIGLATVRSLGDAELKLRAAYGKGIRPPQTPARSAASGYAANPNPGGYGANGSILSLDPEEQSGYETGAELYFGHAVSFQLTRFDQRATGLIQNVVVGIDTFQTTRRPRYQLQNVGEISNTGWEFQSNMSRGPFSLATALSSVDSRVRALASGYNGDLRAGDRMLAVPARTGSITTSYMSGGWFVALGATRATDWVNYDKIALARAYVATTAPVWGRDFTGAHLRSYWMQYNGDTHLRLVTSRDVGHDVTLLVTGENLLGGQLGEPDNATIRPGRTITAGLRAGF